MSQPTVDEIVHVWTAPGFHTHFEGCELAHVTCAVKRLADEVKRAQARAVALEEALMGLGCAPDVVSKIGREVKAAA